MSIKNIIFDMGNVLLHYEPKKYIEKLNIKDEAEKKKVYNAVYFRKESAYLDRGDITDEEYVDIVCKDIGEEYRDYVNTLMFHWADVVDPMVGMVDLIKELKSRGYKIYLLSNASYMQHEYWLRTPGHELFDGTLVSCDAKHVKPEKEIYYALYEKFDIKPEESFFVDDLIINIYGARETGMDGFVFRGDAEDLRNYLKKVSIL